MKYKKFKIMMCKEDYFLPWDKETLAEIDEDMKEYIYQKYVLKCVVFQRDKFKCQNKHCKTPKSRLTLHHIKFKKNNGKNKPKNSATICKTCHVAYHQGKVPLTFNGMTYKLHPTEKQTNWKMVKKEGRVLRKNHKQDWGITISYKLFKILMQFMEKEYEVYDD